MDGNYKNTLTRDGLTHSGERLRDPVSWCMGPTSDTLLSVECRLACTYIFSNTDEVLQSYAL